MLLDLPNPNPSCPSPQATLLLSSCLPPSATTAADLPWPAGIVLGPSISFSTSFFLPFLAEVVSGGALPLDSSSVCAPTLGTTLWPCRYRRASSCRCCCCCFCGQGFLICAVATSRYRRSLQPASGGPLPSIRASPAAFVPQSAAAVASAATQVAAAAAVEGLGPPPPSPVLVAATYLLTSRDLLLPLLASLAAATAVYYRLPVP